jgi:hypothetical protein
MKIDRNKVTLIVASVGFCLFLVGTGCNMDAELTTQYSDNIAFSNETNLNLYLNKFYPLIGQTYYTPEINDDAYSDILKMNDPNSSQNGFVFGTVPVTSSNNVFDNWTWGHTWVLDCNQFLEGLREYGSHLSEEVRLRAEAEVRFFRAHVYFMMARRFGASVILYEGLPDMEEKSRARCTPDECWDFIAADLDFAAEHLEVIPTKDGVEQTGRISKGAAYGLKARTMLYAERWKAASDAAEEVMNLGIYDLYPDYAGLFKLTRQSGVKNKESILEFGYDAPDFGYSFDYFFCPPGDGGYAQVSPTENLVSSYQMADGTPFDWNNPAHAANPYANREPRFYASILYNGASWKGRVIEAYENGVDGVTVGSGSTNTGYYLRKLFDETQVGGFLKSGLTYYYMRYAEIYLIYAEAMAQQDNLGVALEYLNKVRRRAGFTTDLTAGSKSDVLSLIRHERMIELAFEGHRFWDLRRWGLAKSTLDGVTLKGVKPIKNADGTFTYSVISCDNNRTRIYLDKYERFPIPTAEIQRNTLCEQFEEWL